MTTYNHTRGPWFSKREGFSTVYIEARIGGGMLQEVAACGPTEGGTEQQEANARLIAAAPELLEALRLIADTDPIDAALDPQRAVRVAREALAKATGGVDCSATVTIA